MCDLMMRQGPEGRLLNVSPARKGWGTEGYGPGTWLTEWTGHMVDSLVPTPEACRRGHGLESERCSGPTEEVRSRV
jgi:hypothetical protein